MKKIALYGGTFDPIHRAHVSLADHAVNEIGLDELYFMPAFVSPFKVDRVITPGEHRAGMISEILHYNPSFRLSNFEIKNAYPSYTYNALEAHQNMLNNTISFVLGFDSVVELESWYRGKDILRNFPLITSARPGTDFEKACIKIEELKEKYNAVIDILEMPPMDISATLIRNKIRLGESISKYVHPEVEEYIFEHNLYR